MRTIEYPRMLSIEWLRDMYLRKETTPEDVVSEIISRTQEDADMNIWITPPSMEAVAPYLDQLAQMDPADSPLWGIPFAIKDNIDLAGVPTTAGCPDYAYTPDEHAAVVKRLIAAGAIPLGKTNLDQFATGLVGMRSPYGETHNALREELISGGSSSGSAVAVARGHAAFALGTDTAGSGRVPAALNRLVGLKPSLGAWPIIGSVPACASLDCIAVFTHSVEDALAVDHAARGFDDADPWSRAVPLSPPKLPQKICLPKDSIHFFGPYEEEYSQAWKVAVARLNAWRIPIEYVDYDLFAQAAAILYEGPWVAERWAGLGIFIDSHPDAVFPVTEQVLRTGNSEAYDAVSVFEAMHKLQLFKLQARKLLEDAVLVIPTAGGTWTREQVRLDPIGTNREMGRFTNHCNLLDLCAVAVPSDDAAPHIPFGITMFALAENEGLIYGTAKAFMHGSVRLGGNGETNCAPTLSASGSPPSSNEMTLVAVCGLHMRGYPLEKQMLEHGAKFIREAVTAANYQLIKLPTVPVKPGLIKKQAGGASIHLEIWAMPVESFGSFATAIPAPLGIGKIDLLDGSQVPGFICEAYAALDAEDITAWGSWRNLPVVQG